MVNITLGGLIKTYRINKRLSQFDVVTSIGWKDTSRLSKIEQGRVKPTRPVVEKIISALNLSNEERGEFLLTGGYLPSDEEITKVIEIVKEKYKNEFLKFEKVGIFQHSAMDAAAFVAKISQDPLCWWYSDEVQAARNEYVKNHYGDLVNTLNVLIQLSKT